MGEKSADYNAAPDFRVHAAEDRRSPRTTGNFHSSPSKKRMPVSVNNISVAHTKPTLIFEIKDWLDAERFDALTKSFPPSDNAHEVQNKKFTFNVECDGFKYFFEHNSQWNQFLDDMRNPMLLRELNDIYNNYHNRDENWIIGGNYISNLINKFILSKDLVEMKLTFSYLPKGAFIVPHTDAPKKLVSLMLYFPTSGCASEKNNGTRFWRFKSHKAEKYSNFGNQKYESTDYSEFYDDAECFYKTDFVGNCLYGFLKNDLSWHSVDHIDIPDSASRDSINMNINKIDALGAITKYSRKLLATHKRYASLVPIARAKLSSKFEKSE